MMSQKNRKRKAEFTTPEERWMCLQEFEKDKNKKKSLAELAIIAKILLKRTRPFLGPPYVAKTISVSNRAV